MTKLGWFSAVGLASAAAMACSSPPAATSGGGDDDTGTVGTDGGAPDSAPPPDSGLGILRFSPDKSYSGFDGTHAFKLPIAVYDADTDLKVSLDDAAEGTIAPVSLVNTTKTGVTDLGKYFMVTVAKAGTFTVTATSRGTSVTGKITVQSYDAGRYAAGEARYNTTDTTENRRACTNCHGSGSDKIDHSPAVLGTATDEEVKAIITTGLLNNFPIQNAGPSKHRWDVTDAELDGLVTYLRALAPNGFK